MWVKLTVPKFWEQKNIISYALLPFSLIYQGIVRLRKLYYRLVAGKKPQVPVIVVGNITVGGSGKTPMVIYLTELLASKGYRPGIISRGYGGKSSAYPLIVTPNSKVEEVGDEALLLAHRTQFPVVVAPNRAIAVNALHKKCDVIISDDGLQHYALHRDIELVVIDPNLGLENKFCLPAGPLRETIARLQDVDFVIKNYNVDWTGDTYSMIMEPVVVSNLKDPTLTKKITDFKNQVVHAIAGIGNPKRFFQTLRQHEVQVIEHPFPDHHIFQPKDFLFQDNAHIIMTEKDAVKCQTMADHNFWYLQVAAKLSDEFAAQILDKLIAILKNKERVCELVDS